MDFLPRECAAALVGLALLVQACGNDTTAPAPPSEPQPSINVAITLIEVQSPIVTADDEGRASITCRLRMRASASGSGAATWGDVLLRWFVGANRAVPVDSSVLPASQVRSAWGKPDIVVGESQESNWEVLAPVPFGLEIEHRYHPVGGGGPQFVRVPFTCGPTIPDGVEPPAVTALSWRTGPGELEPRDTVEVEYSATSEVGLWQSLVAVSGPCEVRQLVAEHLRRTVSDTLEIVLPAECELGIPITVTVYALDAALQESTRQLATSRVLVDVTPPTIVPLFFPPTGGSASTELSGNYFVGDSVAMIYNASDNHRLRALVWEVLPLGQRDSVVVNTPDTTAWLKIPVLSSWLGASQIEFYARDAVGQTSNVVTSAPGAIEIYPTVDRSVASTSLQHGVRTFVIDSRRDAIYFLLWGDNRVLLFSLATMAVTDSVDLPSHAEDLDVTAGGDSLVVTLPEYRALGFIDLRDPSRAPTVLPLSSLDSTLDQRPRRVRVTANGKAFVAIDGTSGPAYTMLEVDLASGAQTMRADAGNGGVIGFALLERSHDRSTLVLNGGVFQRYDVVSDRFGACGDARVINYHPNLDGAGRYVAVAHDLYDASLTFLRQVQTPVGPCSCVLPAALSVDGQHMFVAFGPWIVRSRVPDGGMVDRSPLPIAADEIRVSADETTLVGVERVNNALTRVATLDLR